MMGSAVRIRASALSVSDPWVFPKVSGPKRAPCRRSFRCRYRLCVFRGVGAVVLAALALVVSAPAQASRGAEFGIQDDAWLMYGPETLAQRLTTLENLGVGVVRF